VKPGYPHHIEAPDEASHEGRHDAKVEAMQRIDEAIVGPIVPPSVIMVVYGVLAQVSIGDLFLAGIVPGLVIGGLLMLMVWFLVATGRQYAPVHPRAPLRAAGRSFVRAIPALMAPVILMVGLLSGVATPTELGAITVVYAAVLGFQQASALPLPATATPVQREGTAVYLFGFATTASP
jgi:TRAP-type C4-dicarboxylate transport system permease large subunit